MPTRHRSVAHAGVPFLMSLFVSAADLEKHDFFTEFLGRHGIRHSLGCWFPLSTESRLCLTLFRGPQEHTIAVRVRVTAAEDGRSGVQAFGAPTPTRTRRALDVE